MDKLCDGMELRNTIDGVGIAARDLTTRVLAEWRIVDLSRPWVFTIACEPSMQTINCKYTISDSKTSTRSNALPYQNTFAYVRTL